MHGVEFRFGLRFDELYGWVEHEQNENINKMLSFLNKYPLTYQYSYWRKREENDDNRPYGHVPHIAVKCEREEEADRVCELFPRWKKEHNVTRREYEVCQVDNCYKETCANGKGCLLFINAVETTWLHEIHEYCVFHVTDRQSRQIARTIETTNDTPGQRLWTKISSFQIDKGFWAQQVQRVDEGGYEEGEILVYYQSLWQGPCATRELAIQAARDYEEE